MPNPHGSFIWYELMSPDLTGARAFYEPLIGWQIDEKPQGPIDYRMIAASDGNVGGALELSGNMIDQGARPIWVGYICVDDVDATADAIVADGGIKFMANDVPGVGRIALLADPWGGLFYIMKPMPPSDGSDASSTAFAPETVGHCAWNELLADDYTAALDFYARHFGWEAGQLMDMGPAGKYQMIRHHGRDIGGMANRQPDGPPAMWSHYWHVADINATPAKIAASGGRVMMGPHDVPGGSAIVMGIDPQGAMFALVGPKG